MSQTLRLKQIYIQREDWTTPKRLSGRIVLDGPAFEMNLVLNDEQMDAVLSILAESVKSTAGEVARELKADARAILGASLGLKHDPA